MSEFVDHIRSSILEDATIHTPYTYRHGDGHKDNPTIRSKTERDPETADGGRASLHHDRQSDLADLHRFAHNVRIENVLTQTVRKN